jgi:orotate phosphoribosyltransferase
VVSIIVALDRMEKISALNRDGSLPVSSAIGETRGKYGIPVLSILDLNDAIVGIGGLGLEEDLRRLEGYRAKYKAAD